MTEDLFNYNQEDEDSDAVTRSYLSNAINKELGFSKAESADLVAAIVDEMIYTLETDKIVKISSFGTFKVRDKKQRIGRNPKTKVEVPITARSVVSFYASNLLKKLINEQNDGTR